MFIQLKMKGAEGQADQHLLILSSKITGVIDQPTGVIITLEGDQQVVVADSFLTVKNRVKDVIGVI